MFILIVIASPDRGVRITGRWWSEAKPLQRMYKQIASPDRGDRTQAGGVAERNHCKGYTSRLQAPIGAIEHRQVVERSETPAKDV